MASLFRSARLTYRAMCSDDLDELYEIYNDPEVILSLMAFNFNPRPENFKDTIKTWSETNPLFVIVVDTETGELVGQASIRYEAPPVMRDGELGLVVKRSMWGKGYGTEICSWVVQHGFKFLGLHRVSLSVIVGNDSAISVYKKVGFVQEGVKRKTRFCDGHWDDLILMGILDDEFFARGNDK